jgi:hypothetical protein
VSLPMDPHDKGHDWDSLLFLSLSFWLYAHAACCPQIRVWFTADVADDMPWTFTPTQEYVTVHPGESVLAFFTAHNRRWALLGDTCC